MNMMMNLRKYYLISCILFSPLFSRVLNIEEVINVSDNFITERSDYGFVIDSIDLQSSDKYDLFYIINLLLGPPANFWYLGARPETTSIMDLMPEPPRHIPIVVTLGLLMFSIIYLPYWVYDRIKSKGAE